MRTVGLAALVLADDDVVDVDGPDRAQQLHLFVADVLGVHRHRLLHGKQRKHLQQVVLHDVADDAIVVEVA